MSDSGFRWLMLSAAGAALTLLPNSSACKADEAHRTSTSNLAIQIVAGNAERVENSADISGIVISPLVLANDEQEPPILVPPATEGDTNVAQSDRVKTAKKPGKPGAKKPGKAPVATETASEKAREEWQKKRSTPGQKRRSKASTKSEKAAPAKKRAADDKDVKETANAKKKALMAKAAANKAKLLPNSSAKGTAMASPAAANTIRRDSRTYQEIYRSIPFSRAEYDANPGYRHLATMEIMLGQLHPIIVAPATPPQPQQNLNRPLTIRIVPSLRYGGFRPGYRPWSRYPWH